MRIMIVLIKSLFSCIGGLQHSLMFIQSNNHSGMDNSLKQVYHAAQGIWAVLQSQTII